MKIIKNFLHKKIRSISKKKLVLTFMVFVAMLFIFVPSALAVEKPNVGERILAGMVNAFASGLNLIVKGLGSPIDKLVFNMSQEKTMGLTILANGKLGQYILEIYQTILWIAASAFVPMGLVVGIDFVRSQDNAQHKAVLKERLLKFVLTFILLTSMPLIMDTIFSANSIAVDVFKDLGINSLKTSGIDIKDGFLVSAFQEKATKSGALLDSCIFIMSVILNLWLVIYYMLRDLSISYLLLLFPIVTIFYPFKKGMVSGWFREMSSNILSQTIHAGIMAIVFGMCATLTNVGKVEDATTLYDSIFALVAFASVIPMTATVKRFVGLEGQVGAASSMAGLGAFMGTMALAGGVANSVKQGYGNIKEGAAELKDLNAQESMSTKNVSRQTSVDSKQLPSINSGSLNLDRGQALSLEEIQGKKAEARRKITQGVVGLGGSAYAGGVMALGSSVFGVKGAAAGAAGGIMVGGAVGNKVGKAAYNTSTSVANDIADGVFGDGNRPELKSVFEGNENYFNGSFVKSAVSGTLTDDIKDMPGKIISNAKNSYNNLMDNKEAIANAIPSDEEKPIITDNYTGLTNDSLQGTTYKEQEQKALLLKKKYERLGQYDKAFRAYAKHTPTRKSPEELENISKEDQLYMYRDKTMSVAFTEKEVEVERDGKQELEIQREVHWTGAGDSSIVRPQVEAVTFNDGSTDLTPNRVNEIRHQAIEKAMMEFPITVDAESPKGKEQKVFQDKMANQYFNTGLKNEQDRIVKLRVELGSNRAYSTTAPKEYRPIPSTNQSAADIQRANIEKLNSLTVELEKQASELHQQFGDKVKYDPNGTLLGSRF